MSLLAFLPFSLKRPILMNKPKVQQDKIPSLHQPIQLRSIQVFSLRQPPTKPSPQVSHAAARLQPLLASPALAAEQLRRNKGTNAVLVQRRFAFSLLFVCEIRSIYFSPQLILLPFRSSTDFSQANGRRRLY